MSVRESIDPNASLWHWLAFDLWFHRTQRSLSLAQVALIAKVSRGSVCNWEAGRQRPQDKHLKLLDDSWNTGGHFQRLMFYARTGHDPDWFRQYLQYEEAAEIIRLYNGKIVPVLAQTETYARALLWSAGRTREAEAESRARMKRQEILACAEPPHVLIIVDQEALECPVGGCEVMRGQLQRLLEIVESPRLSVRVVLRRAGWHPGHDGAFQVLRIKDREVAYAVAQIGGRLIESGDESATLALRFEQIGALALSQDASTDFFKETLRTYK
ncbi:Scr1 family TA system antitoxin-like transcriptional regulator [Spirillospora sp. NPDC127200]